MGNGHPSTTPVTLSLKTVTLLFVRSIIQVHRLYVMGRQDLIDSPMGIKIRIKYKPQIDAAVGAGQKPLLLPAVQALES
jgi:hypothetical protein